MKRNAKSAPWNAHASVRVTAAPPISAAGTQSSPARPSRLPSSIVHAGDQEEGAQVADLRAAREAVEERHAEAGRDTRRIDEPAQTLER